VQPAFAKPVAKAQIPVHAGAAPVGVQDPAAAGPQTNPIAIRPPVN